MTFRAGPILATRLSGWKSFKDSKVRETGISFFSIPKKVSRAIKSSFGARARVTGSRLSAVILRGSRSLKGTGSSLDVIGIAFGGDRAFPLPQFVLGGLVGQRRRFDHALADGLHQGIVADGLDEELAVFSLGRGRQIHLQAEGPAAQALGVDNLAQALELGQFFIVNMMDLVIEN
jgi:hypothetical protein